MMHERSFTCKGPKVLNNILYMQIIHFLEASTFNHEYILDFLVEDWFLSID